MTLYNYEQNKNKKSRSSNHPLHFTYSVEFQKLSITKFDWVPYIKSQFGFLLLPPADLPTLNRIHNFFNLLQ